MSQLRMEWKDYRCRSCGHIVRQNTNHWGATWSWDNVNVCPKCPPYKRPTYWDPVGPIPAGAWVPPSWGAAEMDAMRQILGERKEGKQ